MSELDGGQQRAQKVFYGMNNINKRTFLSNAELFLQYTIDLSLSDVLPPFIVPY